MSELDASRLSHLVGYAASRAAITMRKVFARHMEPLDLKIVEFSILMLVAQNPQVNQKQLGQALDISAPNMAVTLDHAVQRDRHVGRGNVQRAEKIAATMEAPSLAMLSAAERALLIELLHKVASGKAAKR